MMMDNVSIAMGGQGGSPYQELDPEMLRRLRQPVTIPPGGAQEFLKRYLLPKGPDTQKPQGYFREELEGERSYSQAGTDIPDFGIQQAYEQREGGPVFEQMVAGAFGIPDDIIEKRKTLQEMINKPGYPDDVRRKAQQEWIQLMKQSQVRGA